MRGGLTAPKLKDVLWDAQRGRCWLCDERMHYHAATAHSRPLAATIDHVWPVSIYGVRGAIGLALLAHHDCNVARGAIVPTDDDIRKLIVIYQRIPRWWLENAKAGLLRELRHIKLVRARAAVLDAILGPRP